MRGCCNVRTIAVYYRPKRKVMMVLEDAQIVDLYWQRDQEAIRQSALKYGAYCHSIAGNILSSREDAEECVNDTWLRAWNAMPEGRPTYLGSFLGTITRRLACSRLRSDRARKRGGGQVFLVLEELEQCIPAAPGADRAVEARELEQAVNAFLHTLPARECSVFLRRYWFAESVDAIARRYDIRPGTVKSSLYRSRQKLKAYLEKEGLV